ncbi:SAVED domain-containing protein [Cytobacillus firmus]|uniref:SMODS-associated and fused to various effectors domain-containing protein n=1 Tax=Cytobacillus oceanisediminis TaxID=665099 RepID=A0ABX3CJY5_9BACI|nr:SAVED domain-containing protein [Cytobacillus oceanisediminis]OHX41396.1 hypothetical protein BBV17_28790 [Cytobacillus oceanisediminis]
MSEEKMQKPSLLEPESTGGDIAEGGFEFQRNLILNKIPYWLSFEGFTSLIWESIGDIEAKFYIPGNGLVNEVLEAKNHQVTASEFWNEIDRFKRLDKGSPNTYQWFTLSCTAVSPKIKPLINGLRRIRDPYPFYEESSGIHQNSYEQYKELVLGLNKDEATAEFLFKKVRIEDTWGSLNAQAEGVFLGSLYKNFPEFEDIAPKKAKAVLGALINLLVSRRNKPLTRLEIEDTISSTVDDARIFVKPTTIETKIARDDLGGKEIIFDWQLFFGGHERSYPAPDTWTSQVIKVLNDTKEWIIKNRKNRTIQLKGNRRNSTAMAIGHTFSAVSGFNIEMDHRGELWKTNQFQTPDTPQYHLQYNFESGQTKRLIVVVGIMKERMAEEVVSFITDTGESDHPILKVSSSMPIISSEQVNAAVYEIKEEIKNITSRIGVKEIDFFYAGPSHFALFLGHRWNAMPITHCYEWTDTANYVKTVTLT